MASNDIPLGALYTRALKSASRAYYLPSNNDETQEHVQAALNDLQLLYTRISSLSLFSRNETLDDVATRDLIYMSIPYLYGEVESSARTTVPDQRKERLAKAEALFKAFLSGLEDYKIVPEGDKAIFGAAAKDPAKRRETKIAQFKREKEIKARIETLRKKKGLPEVDMSNAFDLASSVATLAPSSTDEDASHEDELREMSLLLLRLQWVQATNQLESISQEMELLRNAPPKREGEPQGAQEDNTWKLDNIPRQPGGGLLDTQGRPMRPFMILPNESERQRFEREVFRPDHRLPTMTIDQYLQEEQRRGNVLTGGGPQSANAPTKSEQLELDAEMDGTAEGERRAEQKRQEDEEWAQYTDTHPRGAGNTMNRG